MRILSSRPAKVFAAALLTATILGSMAWANMTSSDLRSKLHAHLMEFAKANALTGMQMRDLVGEAAIGELQLSKGGIGVISNDLFIRLNENHNALVVKGIEWQGMQSDEAELVVVCRGEVVCSTNSIDSSDAVIVIFSGSMVRYVDLRRNVGGVYCRKDGACKS